MRSPVIVLLLAASASSAAGDTPVYKLVEDSALGLELAADRRVLGDKHAAALAACAPGEAASGAVFWLELNRAGTVTTAKVRGSGKPTLDTCLEAALRKANVADKLPGPIVLVGHIDLKVPDRDGYFPSPRQSTTPVLLAPHGAKWQLTVNHLAYTSNRAADIAQALDAASPAIAACAPKRGRSAEAAQAIAWTDGKAIVRSGAPAYDSCVARALDSIKPPTPESALWMKLAITAPAEPLAPRTDRVALSKDQALRDALTTAVRSRKELLLTCVDGRAKATLTKVSLALTGAKAKVSKVATGDAEADECVRKKFGEVAIPSAKPADKLELEITLVRE